MKKLTAEPYQFEELKNGNPLQVRTTVSSDESKQIRKGDEVEVVSESSTLHARIISDPIVVIDRKEEGKSEISLEISTRDESATEND